MLRGLSTTRDAQLWLEYSDTARAADGAWLETADGQRFELSWWGWDPDVTGTRGVRLVFPALPAEVTRVTLALPEGWRIPLEWIPAAESSLQPVNLTLDQPSPTPPEGEAAPVDTGTNASERPCVEAAALHVCAQAAAFSAQGLEVMLEAQASGDLKPGILQGHNLIAFAAGDSRLRLTDAQGGQYDPSDATRLFPYSEDRLGEGLIFSTAGLASGRLELEIPGFFANLPLSHEIVVDLGEDPQAGQTIRLDDTIDAAGMPVHFSQALVEEDGSGGLRLKVSSDPVETRDGLTPYLLMLAKPDRVDSGWGEGSEQDGVLSLSVDLLQPSGKLSGTLRLPLVGVSMRVDGPFYVSFDAPAPLLAAAETPEVIEGGDFIPLPSGEALPMDVYQYSGRALQPGDLLTVSAGAATSYLLASSQGEAAQIVAVLPGQVLAVYVHADRGGIDYVTGAADPDQGYRYDQLYTLRFDGDPPRLLVGSFERLADDFRWSFDGRWLGYLAPRSGPGESGARQVHLVDLACRESGACQGQAVDAPENLDLHDLAWSPVEERLLVMGVPQTQTFGMSDVFTIKIGDDSVATLTNLTELPQIDDQGAAWLPDGMKLFITCSISSMELNFYGLCRNDLQVGMDALVVERLPYNMRLALLSPNGKLLVDRVPVFENGVQRLRAYDIDGAEMRVLAEWPAAKGGFTEPAISPDFRESGVG